MASGRVFNTRVGGMAALVLAMFLGGSSIVAAKFLNGTLPVFLLTFSTLLAAFFSVLPMAARRWKEIAALTPRQWIYLAMQALCGIVLFRIFTLYGLDHTGAVQAGVILGTTPAVLTILAVVLLKERPTPGGIAGVVCAVCGMICLNLSSAGGGGGV